jgi:predicted lipoprotein with Yx(FWY)xxD motif
MHVPLHKQAGHRRTLVAVLAVTALAALLVAGCGGGSGGYGSAAKPAAKESSTVGLATTDLGKVLVDGNGRTLYLFEADKPSISACSGTCATTWPPLTTSAKPQAGPGVSASMLGTIERADGKTEITYGGHPLYRYTGDSAAGQTAGEGSEAFGAEWYVVSPSGSKIEDES